MNTLSRFQLNAILAAALSAAGQSGSSQTIDALSLLGTNSTVAWEYNRAKYLNNRGAQAHIPPGVTNSQRDSNGYPLVGGTWKITSNYNSLADGQLDPATTYHCYYTIDPSNPTHATPGTGMTASGLTIVGTPTVRSDGVTTDFVMAVPSLTNGAITFNGGITFLAIPTDGVTDPRNGPEFDPDCIAHHAKMASFRTMDLLLTISNPQVAWADRTVDFGPLSPGAWSPERVCRFVNAIKAAPGSRLKYVWWNIPAKVNDDYVTQLSLVLSANLNPALIVIPERGNEPWNPNGGDDYGVSYWNALQECQFATTSGLINSGATSIANIASMSSDGTTVSVTMGSGFSASASGTNTLNVGTFGTGAPLAIGQTIYRNNASTGVTITGYGTGTGGAGTYTLSGPLTFSGPAQAVGGALPAYVVTGAQMLSYVDGGSGAWRTGSLAHPTTITVSGSTFTYTANTANSETSVPASGAVAPSAINFYFNLSSTLLADGTSFSVFTLTLKWHIRRTLQMRNLWKVSRPNDKWILNLQFSSFGTFFDNIAAFPPPYLAYADWLGKNYVGGGGGASGWLEALAVAPYCTTSGYFVSAPQNLTGPSVIHGVAWAPYAQVGSTVSIHGVGTTTVAAGSSGTDLMVAAAVPTAITQSNTNTIALTASVDATGSEVCNFLIYQGIPVMESIIRGCAYNARLYGLKLFAYEIGPDTGTSPAWPTMQIPIHSNPLMGTVVSKLLDAWFNGGGQIANYFTAVVDNLLNIANGAWGSMTSWTDTTSPKIAAILAKFGQTRVLGNHYGSTAAGPVVLPADYTTKIGGGGAVKTLTSTPAGGTSTGSVYWFTNTQLRFSDWTFTAHRPGNYRIDVWLSEGTTSSPGLAGVFIDGAQVGTAQSVAGTGAGTSAGAVPQLVTSLTVALTLDYHNLSVQFAPNVGLSPGIYQVVVTAL